MICKVIAVHAALAPENTLTAFKTALAIGVTTLETDLALTRDGVLVLSHEPRLYAALTRGPDGRWLSEDGAAIFSLKPMNWLSTTSAA